MNSRIFNQETGKAAGYVVLRGETGERGRFTRPVILMKAPFRVTEPTCQAFGANQSTLARLSRIKAADFLFLR
jgi:hypothetical protein